MEALCKSEALSTLDASSMQILRAVSMAKINSCANLKSLTLYTRMLCISLFHNFFQLWICESRCNVISLIQCQSYCPNINGNCNKYKGISTYLNKSYWQVWICQEINRPIRKHQTDIPLLLSQLTGLHVIISLKIPLYMSYSNTFT
jgi:hypothetical protein